MLESIENQYQRIGHIARSHGVQGDVLIIPDRYAPTLFDSLDLVRIKNTRGDLIPARIESVRVQEKDNRLSFFVKFEHVTDRTQADRLKQLAVYINRDLLKSESAQEDGLTDLTAFEIWVDNRSIGTVESVIQNPAHPILQVVTEEGEQLLMPFVDEYVAAVDEERERLQCRNLEQLKGL